MGKRTIFWLRASFILLMLVQFSGTHYPVYEHEPSIPMLDKVFHFSAYLLLMIFFRLNWPKCSFWICLALAGGYGMFDELTQLLAIGRSAEVLDWCADVLGAAAGFYLFDVLRKRGLIISKTDQLESF